MASIFRDHAKGVYVTGIAYHVMYLKNQFRQRSTKNTKYSLRAFAKDIDIDVGQLSKTISGKLSLSIRRASSIIKNLNATPEERELFLQSVAKEQASLADDEPIAKNTKENSTKKFSNKELDYDIFLVISDLTHFALLELTYLHDFKSDHRWMARQLKVPVIEVQAALNRLVRLGMLKIVEGTIQKTDKNLSTGYKEFSSSALRAHHRQVLKQAQISLNRDSHEIRSNHSVTLTIDEKKIKIAREMTMKFLNELTQVLESGKQTKLYQISFNIFPLQMEE